MPSRGTLGAIPDLLHETDRVLRAGHDAETTGAASIRGGRVSRLPAVGHALEPAEERQRREMRVVDAPDLEDGVGADIHAVALAFAPRAIDDRPVSACFCSAIFSRSIGVASSASRFVAIDGCFGHLASFRGVLPFERRASVVSP